jgi:nicotinate-nucleotide pyrophosphorylase (carboxylating)
MRPDAAAIQRLVRMALDEDAPWGDITSQAFVAAQARVTAQLVAREAGVLCGEDLFVAAMTMSAIEPAEVSAHFSLHDGESFRAGDVLATVTGPARAVLQGERVALNFVQRLSGIATLTAKYVAAAKNTEARVVDTRKTTPGLRLVERYAVRCGGGHNHRYSLSDAALVKDNHIALMTGGGPAGMAQALQAGRALLPHTAHLEVEVDRLDQIEAALAGGADTVLLDNFSLPDLRAGMKLIAGRALVEASGGVTLDRIADIAATGVDLISVGALTHSVRSLDMGLDIEPK